MDDIDRYPPAGFVIQRPYPKPEHYEVESHLCDIDTADDNGGGG